MWAQNCSVSIGINLLGNCSAAPHPRLITRPRRDNWLAGKRVRRAVAVTRRTVGCGQERRQPTKTQVLGGAPVVGRAFAARPNIAGGTSWPAALRNTPAKTRPYTASPRNTNSARSSRTRSPSDRRPTWRVWLVRGAVVTLSISSADHRVVGLTPHPEGANEALTGPSDDGLGLFSSVLDSVPAA